jgi:hypothetical protein
MFVVQVQKKGTSQDNEEKETSKENVQRQNKRRKSEKIPERPLGFSIALILSASLWPLGRLRL